MSDFYFKGDIPASKSVLNRALIVKSFFSKIEISGESTCEDVVHMGRAVHKILETEAPANIDIDCGDGGTVLRFMAFRLSRIPGRHRLFGSDRLLHRPQKEIAQVLNQLGVRVEFNSDHVLIEGDGWKNPQKVLQIDRSDSSQFASGLALSAWNLDFDLNFKFNSEALSESYWQLTVKMLTRLGMEIEQLEDGTYFIKKEQKTKKRSLLAEIDMSSAFSIAAAAALAGRAEITNWFSKSEQPDRIFVDYFKRMGIQIKVRSDELMVESVESYGGLDCDLAQSPDMFPVLAVVCGYANGSSLLRGAPHIVAKESNRLEKTKELLQKMGVLCIENEDGLLIEGMGRQLALRSFEFDPDHDHRMAMAAGIASLMGHDIQILHRDVVNKSFPEFWLILAREES